MKLFFYYAFCSVKNQIRKLFKTWVAVFVAVCFLFGLLIGVGAGFLDELTADRFPEEDTEYEENVTSPSEEEEFPEEEWTEADTELLLALVELAAGAIILVTFTWNAFSSDKSGCAIFQPADVNLLFASPMKPQSVLLFRLMAQIAATLVVTFYFILQIPATLAEADIPLFGYIGIMAALILMIVFGNLLQILLYTVGSTYPHIKARIRPVILGILGAVALAFVGYWQLSGLEPFPALQCFFNAPVTRWIPVWGWLKAILMSAITENVLGFLLSLIAMLIATVGLIYIIWNLRADFYEDAMAKSEETAAMQAAMTEGRGVRRKKDRTDSLRRDGLSHGRGANVYFFKTLYNRFRFAHFHVFTKTSETYLAVGVGVSLILRYVVETRDMTAVALVLAALAFFRSLGNPIAEDIENDSFLMVPENPWAKVLWSMLGGSLNCLLDLIPGILAAMLILGVHPVTAIAWMLFIVTLDIYSGSAGLFINLSVPSSIAKNIKGMIQIMFLYFGLLPDAILLILGGILGIFPIMAIIAACINLAIGGVFYAFSPMFLAYGRK